MIGHSHRYISEDSGAVLAYWHAAADDPGLDPHSPSDKEIDEGFEEE